MQKDQAVADACQVRVSPRVCARQRCARRRAHLPSASSTLASSMVARTVLVLLAGKGASLGHAPRGGAQRGSGARHTRHAARRSGYPGLQAVPPHQKNALRVMACVRKRRAPVGRHEAQHRVARDVEAARALLAHAAAARVLLHPGLRVGLDGLDQRHARLVVNVLGAEGGCCLTGDRR